ncbi:branched-chain amino acid aminotransferase [Bacillus salipaludis]|uniref:Branched-chain amino acid aminotransferase n=1 Tax=Bacillus salipaludis TaxID=2547811 RepID=A0AA90R8M9_9BACI|nr:branched-chain amino acid aminotransferase [Bacillus salipaludis]MDQ6598548.1 branched-chain amino acid aminotransferase [Bacillus salipaludis]
MANQQLLEDAYIERCDKETEELIAKETFSFLTQPLDYLKKHKKEFLFLESKQFDAIHVDAVSLEVDDVFGTYDVMLGLRFQKKFGNVLKEELNQNLKGSEAKFDLLFSNEDGLWDLNFALNYVEGYREDLSIGEAFELIHQFLVKLVEKIK